MDRYLQEHFVGKNVYKFKISINLSCDGSISESLYVEGEYWIASFWMVTLNTHIRPMPDLEFIEAKPNTVFLYMYYNSRILIILEYFSTSFLHVSWIMYLNVWNFEWMRIKPQKDMNYLYSLFMYLMDKEECWMTQNERIMCVCGCVCGMEEMRTRRPIGRLWNQWRRLFELIVHALKWIGIRIVSKTFPSCFDINLFMSIGTSHVLDLHDDIVDFFSR